MDGGKKRCCNRETCPFRDSSERSDEQTPQQLATQSSPPASGVNSTQILFVEPNFTETPSEYEVFHDCYSDCGMGGKKSSLCSSFCATLKDLPKVIKRMEDPHEFRARLQQIVYTSRKLLKNFDEAYRKGRQNKSNESTVAPNLREVPATRVHEHAHARTAHVELTARIGGGGSGGSGRAREIHFDQYTIRIEPITFKIPLKLDIQADSTTISPHSCAMAAMIQQIGQLMPQSTFEPIRTATISADPNPYAMGPMPLALPPTQSAEQSTADAARESATGDSKSHTRDTTPLSTDAHSDKCKACPQCALGTHCAKCTTAGAAAANPTAIGIVVDPSTDPYEYLKAPTPRTPPPASPVESVANTVESTSDADDHVAVLLPAAIPALDSQVNTEPQTQAPPVVVPPTFLGSEGGSKPKPQVHSGVVPVTTLPAFVSKVDGKPEAQGQPVVPLTAAPALDSKVDTNTQTQEHSSIATQTSLSAVDLVEDWHNVPSSYSSSVPLAPRSSKVYFMPESTAHTVGPCRCVKCVCALSKDFDPKGPCPCAVSQPTKIDSEPISTLLPELESTSKQSPTPPVDSTLDTRPIPPPKPQPKRYRLALPQHKDIDVCAPCRYDPSPLIDDKGNVFCPYNCGCCLCAWKPRLAPDDEDTLQHKKLRVCKCGRKGTIFGNFVSEEPHCSNTSFFDVCPCREKAEAKHLELYGEEMWNTNEKLMSKFRKNDVLLSEVVPVLPRPR